MGGVNWEVGWVLRSGISELGSGMSELGSRMGELGSGMTIGKRNEQIGKWDD